ncbi:MAG: hydroxysqualene dehydroxylase HpnE [Candidatus Nitrotoga sp.]
MNIAIVGAGYAGMAAAVTLAARNIPVTVFETSKQLGGRARGLWHNETQLDNGQHILLGCYRHTLQLIRQVGGNIENDFLRLPLQLTLHHRFSFQAYPLPAPLHILLGLISAQGLSFAQKLSAARFILAMRHIQFSLPGDISAIELLNRYRQDHELISLLWQPICISALNTPLHLASARILLNVLRDSLNTSRADSDMLLPRLDYSALFPDRAAKYLQQRHGNLYTSSIVEAIIPRDHTIELTVNSSNGNAPQTHLFSHVICATSPTAAARLLQSVPQLAPLAREISAIPNQPIYTVYLQYPAHVQLPHPMLGFDQCYTQWLFDKGQISSQHGLIASVISAEGLHQELSQENLAQKVVQELHEQMSIAETPLWVKVIAEKRATFSCEVNLNRPPHTTAIKNLLLAGDYTAGEYPATLEGAVMSGMRCANEVILIDSAR